MKKLTRFLHQDVGDVAKILTLAAPMHGQDIFKIVMDKMGEQQNLKEMVWRILDGTILGTPAKSQPGKPPKAPKTFTLPPAAHVSRAGGGRISLRAQNSETSIDI